MSEYIRGTYGPGDIAALPPTIGSGDGGPTIGAEDVGHRIKKAFPFHQRRVPGATMVEAAGVKLPMNGYGMGNNGIFANGNGVFNGMGTNGNGNGSGMPAWALPVGVGLVLGGLYVMFAKKREHGGILPNDNYDLEPLLAGGHYEDDPYLENVAKPSFWKKMAHADPYTVDKVFGCIVEIAKVSPTKKNLDNAYLALAYAVKCNEQVGGAMLAEHGRVLTRAYRRRGPTNYAPPKKAMKMMYVPLSEAGLIMRWDGGILSNCGTPMESN